MPMDAPSSSSRHAASQTRYPGVPFMALTATATTGVQQDILSRLAMPHARVFKVRATVHGPPIAWAQTRLRLPSHTL